MNFAKKSTSMALLARRCLLNHNISKMSTQIQKHADQNQTIETTIPAIQEPEKDKLFSHLEIELKGIEPEVMKSYAWFANSAAQHLGITVGRCWAKRKSEKDRLTLLKSVHIYSKHLVQYEVRTYYRFMNFHNLTQSTLETFLEYIQRNLPEGTAMKATKVEIQKLPEHLAPSQQM